MSLAIKIEKLSKRYRLGVVSAKTLKDDLHRWWWKIKGKGDPLLKIGQDSLNNYSPKDYVWALKDINLEVEQGEVLGIIGKNGAGKSTLLKILSRITTPTEGTAKIRGRLGSLLEVGTGFHPELTGRENIYLNGAIHGMTRHEIAKKLDDIVDFAGVAKYIDTPVKRYSSGMYVRLGFAVAAFLEPDILVVDEVLAVGDAEFQKRAIGKMQEVSQGEGRTVLFVSHNMASIRSLCTRAILLENGRIKFDGNTQEAIDKYLSFDEDINEKLPVYTEKLNTTKKVQVLELKITSTQGELKTKLPYDKPFVINAKLKIKTQDKFYFAIHIVDRMGELIIMNRFFSDKDFAYDDKKEFYNLKLEYPPLLVPGKYSINFHIVAMQPIHFLARAENVCHFELYDNSSYYAKIGFPWYGKLNIFPSISFN